MALACCGILHAIDSPTFLNTHYALDTIVHGDTVAIAYPFINTTGDSVIVDDIQTSCGCLAAVDGGSIYGPGDTGSITVTFSSSGQRESSTRELPVVFRAPDDSTGRQTVTVVLSFTVAVRHEVQFSPPLLYGMCHAAAEPPILAGAVVNAGDSPVRVVSLVPDSSAHFEVLTRQLPVELDVAESLPFSVVLQAGTVPEGGNEVGGTIRVHTDNTTYAEHACDVYWYCE